MKGFKLSVLFLIAALCLALAMPVCADEQPEPDLAADALRSPGDPPVIPHAVRPDQDGEDCNACHREGVKGAPPTSHPERLNCTSCHVQSVPDQDAKPSRKGKGK